MKRELTHEEAFAALDAAALDALDSPERESVLSHVGDCAICRIELASLRDTAALLAFSSPLGTDTARRSRDRIRSKLAARASADRHIAIAGAPATVPEPDRTAARRLINLLAWRRAEWVAIAAGVMLVASVALLAWTLRQREDLTGALQIQTAMGERAVSARDSLRKALTSRDSIMADLTGKDVTMMTLTSNGTRSAFAHMFWNRTQNTWTLVAHNMPDLKPGRTYQLWLVTPQGKVSAGTFASNNGDAMIRTTHVLTATDLKAIAVTEEPAGGMPQPTGPMVMTVATR